MTIEILLKEHKKERCRFVQYQQRQYCQEKFTIDVYPQIAKFGVKFRFYLFNDKNIAVPEKNPNTAIFVGIAQLLGGEFVNSIEYARNNFKWSK